MKSCVLELKKIKNKSLLVVFPHPDDESVMAGGLILKALDLGWEVVVICLTRGGLGKIHVNGRGKNTTEIREDEFEKAMQVLGVSLYHVWDFPDGQLRRTNSWKTKLASLIEDVNPGLVVTYDHSGVSGHPDHIALSIEIFGLLRDSSRCFDRDRSVPLRMTRLWWPSFSGVVRGKFVEPCVGDLLVEPSLRLDLTVKDGLTKWQAVRAHSSQGWSKLSMWPMCLGFLLKYRYEEFAEADLRKNYEHRYVKFKF